MTQDAEVVRVHPGRGLRNVSTRTGKGVANSRKNRSHVIPTLIPTLSIKEGRAGGLRVGPGSGTRIIDDPSLTGAQHTC